MEDSMMARATSAPMLDMGGNGGAKFACKALVLTTPRRNPQKPQTAQRRQRAQGLRSLTATDSRQGSAATSMLIGDQGASLPNIDQPRPASMGHGSSPLGGTNTSDSSGGRLVNSKNQKKRTSEPRPRSSEMKEDGGGGSGGSEAEGVSAFRIQLVQLRKQLHRQACEFQETKDELVGVKRELWEVTAKADELRLKLTNLERIDRTKSSELLEERRKNDEMSKQVKEMSANLLSLTGSLDGGNGEASGMRKRCFKLVQQNTALSVQSRLLQRQKGWAEAKARVLQNEVTRVYLGVHERVKDDTELEAVMLREFAARQFPTDEAQIYQLLNPFESVHQEAVVDFITHITHTHGMDIHGFLSSSRVFSEAIRNDCLSGLAREFYATWRRISTLPHILRAVERVVHLSDYLAAFESFSTEITALLGCAHAKIWVVDRFRNCMWSCVRDGDGQKTFTLKLPRGKTADLTGMGIACAAYLTQKPVNVGDAREDPRYRQEEEAGADGHAKSIMCVPVCRMAKAGRQPQVRVVLQAVNKLQEPHFDPDRDGRVLRLLGKVSMEVIDVCEMSSASTMNTKRKEALLQNFIECTPCDTPEVLLSCLERGLADTFLAQTVALHVVTGTSTMHVSLNKHQNKLSQVTCDGFKGIVGMVAKTMNQNTILASQVESSRYDPSVDLPEIEKTVMHTVPICEGSGCVAVCQFACPERERALVGDDGAYHPENTSHFRLILLLLTFVQKHLHIVSAPKPTADELLAKAEVKAERDTYDPPSTDPEPQAEGGCEWAEYAQKGADAEHSGDENRQGSKNKRMSASTDSKKKEVQSKVQFKNEPPNPSDAPLAEQQAAATKLQSCYRGNVDRAKTKEKAVARRASATSVLVPGAKEKGAQAKSRASASGAPSTNK